MANPLETSASQQLLSDDETAGQIIADISGGAVRDASLEVRFRAMLNADLVSDGGITMNRGSAISRKHYARRLGLTENQFYRDKTLHCVLLEVEKKLTSLGLCCNPVETRLRLLLDRDFNSPGGIRLGPNQKQINRQHYANEMGISHTIAARTFRHVFMEYDEKLAAAGLTMLSDEGRLRSMLEADRETPEGIRSIRGAISKKHYAKRLGVSTYRLTALQHVLDHYKADIVDAGPSQIPVSEMRAWLEEQYQARELVLRNGKFDRSAVARAFGWKSAEWASGPQFRTLIEEFDRRAAAEGYLSKSLEREIDKLKQALSDPCPLIRDRLTIHRPKLCEATGITISRMQAPPFVGLIEAKEAEILAGAKASRIDPFIHGRPFPFSDLAPVWPTAFLERVGTRFRQVFAGYSKASVPSFHRALRGALEWIGKSDHSDILSDLRERDEIRADAWEDALHAFRSHVKSRIGGDWQDTTADAILGSLRVGLIALETGGIVPPVSSTLAGIRYARRKGGHQKSVAEVSRPESGGVTDHARLGDYVDFARSRLVAAAEALRVDLSLEEDGDFLNVLSAELEARGSLPPDPSQAVLLVLSDRLGRLHNAARQIFERWLSHHQDGPRLLSKATIDAVAFMEDYASGRVPRTGRSDAWRRFFPGYNDRIATPDEAEIGIPNLLALGVACFGGILPESKNAKAKQAFGDFFKLRYREYSGLPTLDAYLNPHKDAVGAAVTLYLLESGANVGVGRTLSVDCIEASDLPDHKRITGFKARAQGKPIIVDLPATSAAVRAIEWLTKATEQFRQQISVPDDQDNLFLLRIGGRCQAVGPDWYRHWFQKFAVDAAGEPGLRFSPSMIRPSVLLKAALENDGRLALGMAIGQHTEPVTQGYQVKWPVRLVYDAKIRSFQNSFEALVARNIETAAAKLGISAGEFERRIGQLKGTGLGTFCADPHGRPGSDGARCQTFDCWNDCPQMIIVGEVEAIASLQIWQRSLLQAEPEWERDHPERWEEIWLPWLCLTQVVEEKMARGPLIKVWRAAERRAVEIEGQPGFMRPRPW